MQSAPQIRELMEVREEAYREAADMVISVDGKDFETIVKEIEEKSK